MPDNEIPESALNPVVRRRRWFRTVLFGRILLILLIAYLLIAYLLLPWDWMRYARRHPALNDAPGITRTAAGIPGDPINIALVGTEVDLHVAMLAAKWSPADPITLKSTLRIAADTVLKHAYADAPVSNLYLWDRKQDFAFEQPLKEGPRRRHHVRFWRSASLDVDGKPMWFGSVTFDTKVGLSHKTGEITHHIDSDIDRERNKLIDDLRQNHQMGRIYWIDGFHEQRTGKNGGGDPFFTDGRLGVVVLDGSASF
jgi:hypothetical protein